MDHTAVGAYIFAGGFTVGMSEHFDILAHLEDGDFGVETFKQNFPQIPVYTPAGNWLGQNLARALDNYTTDFASPRTRTVDFRGVTNRLTDTRMLELVTEGSPNTVGAKRN